MRNLRIGLELVTFAVAISWATQADAAGRIIESMLIAGVAGIIASGLFLELTCRKSVAK